MENKKKLITVAVSVAIIAVVCIIAVQAYLSSKQDVQNHIIPAQISCRVDEEFAMVSGVENRNIKETVTVANTGTHDAYIRIIAVTYWQDTKGNVVEKKSEDLKLSSIVNKNDWIIGKDNVIYYNRPIAAGISTADLLLDGKNITVVKVANEEEGFGIFEYYQVVEFIAEAIQASPDTAVTESWGVTLNDDGTINTVPN